MAMTTDQVRAPAAAATSRASSVGDEGGGILGSGNGGCGGGDGEVDKYVTTSTTGVETASTPYVASMAAVAVPLLSSSTMGFDSPGVGWRSLCDAKWTTRR